MALSLLSALLERLLTLVPGRRDEREKQMAKKKEVYSTDPKVQAHYDACIKAGCDHKMADLLASRTAPKVRDTYSPMHPRRGRGKGRNY